MSTAKRVAKNTGFLYIRIGIQLVIALYSTRLILSALGIEDFGIYNLVAGSIAMLNFLNSAMAEATQRFMSFAQGEGNITRQKSIFNVSLILHLIIAVFIVFVLEIIGHFLFKSVLDIPEERIDVAKLVYQFMIANTFFTIIKVPYDAVLIAHENMFLIAVLGVIQSILKLGVALYITYTGFDQLISYGLLMAILSIFIISLSYFYCRFKYVEVKINFSKYFDKHLLKEMGSFASWSLLSQSAFIITMQGSTIVLNTFFGVIVNAAQGISNQVSSQLKTFSFTMQKALNPVIVKREGERNRAKMLEVSIFGNKVSFFVISFLSIPLLIEMPQILDLWLKDVPEFAVIFCRLQLLRLIVGTLTQSFYVAIGAIGKIKQDAILESIIFISVLPISFLMYKLGASTEMIYINLIFMNVGISIVRVFILNRIGGLSVKNFMLNVFVRCLGVFVITFLISYAPLALLDISFWRLLVVSILSSLSFIGLVYAFGFNKIERMQIIRIIPFVAKKYS